MTYRDIYSYLIRCHPSRFQEQFEDEMLASFDDASLEQDAGRLVLVIDAFISLLRQWLLRSGNWEHVRRVSAQGGALPIKALRRQSEEFHSRAWRINKVFLATCLMVTFILSLTTTRNMAISSISITSAIVLMLFGAIAYPRYKDGKASVAQHHEALSILSDPRRSELVRKRDSLRIWAGGKSRNWPCAEDPLAVASFYTVLSLSVTYVLWRNMGALPGTMPPSWLWLCKLGLVAMAVLSCVARKLNRVAASALQQEIDALDLTRGGLRETIHSR